MKTLIFITLLIAGFQVSVSASAADKSNKNKMEHSDHKGHDHAGHDNHDHGKDHKHEGSEASIKSQTPEKLVITVKGMVCAFCAQGITKNFNAREEVKDTKVDLDKMEVTLQMVKGKSLSKDVIKDIVTGAGFKFVEVK